MGGVLRSVDGRLPAGFMSVIRGLDISGEMSKSMSLIAVGGDQRAAFNAILLATTASVAKKPNFNLELEINDLWIRLGNLRNSAPSGGGHEMIHGLSGMTKHLPSMLGNIESAMQNLVKGVGK